MRLVSSIIGLLVLQALACSVAAPPESEDVSSNAQAVDDDPCAAQGGSGSSSGSGNAGNTGSGASGASSGAGSASGTGAGSGQTDECTGDCASFLDDFSEEDKARAVAEYLFDELELQIDMCATHQSEYGDECPDPIAKVEEIASTLAGTVCCDTLCGRLAKGIHNPNYDSCHSVCRSLGTKGKAWAAQKCLEIGARIPGPAKKQFTEICLLAVNTC
jgi:hypothetical protein